MNRIDQSPWAQRGQRLAAALLGRGSDLAITHQTLADELGTVREIITRLLRRFEREGWVALSREHIHISNSAALRTLASALSGSAPALTRNSVQAIPLSNGIKM